eukprot:TRINITY_DN2933_c0_g1_i4.p1 TRINITY_DN2933_c0_g1~~TRINITY_DN2933_c0_g1_i4.p1  ORF type:complete len:267 (-),score=50.07 TRINITY_DN2933_c0_g1_i4:155-955(-)
MQIVVATIAFGMGIDKGDCRFVIHFNVPKSLEGFYQESGRAGRDGAPALSLLYWSGTDGNRNSFLIGNQSDTTTSTEAAKESWAKVIQYSTVPTCRRKQLLSYFGENVTRLQCRNCDLCLGTSHNHGRPPAPQSRGSYPNRNASSTGIGPVYNGKKNAGAGTGAGEEEEEEEGREQREDEGQGIVMAGRQDRGGTGSAPAVELDVRHASSDALFAAMAQAEEEYERKQSAKKRPLRERLLQGRGGGGGAPKRFKKQTEKDTNNTDQ